MIVISTSLLNSLSITTNYIKIQQPVPSHSVKIPNMANIQLVMDQESDDDCEVYFLKPVNEYNIVDKIKEANKELFGNEMGNELELITDAQQNRKVSFAANLEEYEPKNGINLKHLEIKLGKNDMEGIEKHFQKTDNEQKLEIITEEESINEIETCETTTEEIEYELEEQKPLWSKESSEDAENYANQFKLCVNEEEENIALEEICEEIRIMDMESEKSEITNAAKYESPGNGSQRNLLKQITFDLTAEDDEIDNKSLTNLLISDNENDSNQDDMENLEYNCNESLYNDTDSEDKERLANTEYYDDDVDDDKLSIIVASYLPDDKTFLAPLNLKNSPRSFKTHKLPFNKRFSLRRKVKSSNSIGSCTNHHITNNGRFMPPPEVTDLKLHYKTCCAFKNVQQNLPKYTGYISEYGLSREQLMERERKLQQKQQNKVVETFKTSEIEGRKMHDNERAFTTWLKNKMRFPINKTRNMFDVKRPFGLRKCTSLGGNALRDDTRQILNTTKYRSISAKFRKSTVLE